MNRGLSIVLLVLLCVAPALGRDPLPEQTDAARVYLAAESMLKAESPSASNLVYSGWYPPSMPGWMELAKASYEENQPAFELVRRARSLQQATWPASDGDRTHLRRVRHLANHLSDAALYAHTQGRDAEAVELLLDTLHMAALLRKDAPADDWVRPMVAWGVESLVATQMTTIGSDVKLGDADGQLPLDHAQRVIAAFLDAPKSHERALAEIHLGGQDARTYVEVHRRAATELHSAAVALACHLFRAEHGRWPTVAEELVLADPSILPAIPPDPWNDGKPLGYVLIKGGLPDGGDRPLVYSHCEAQDGLHYRVDQPHFGFYHGDGSNRPLAEHIRGGQFRDVVRWTPPDIKPDPTFRPLER